jgi:hypothetical protein
VALKNRYRESGVTPKAFWLEEKDYDVNKRVETPVNPEKLTVVSNHVFKTTQIIAFNADGSIRKCRMQPVLRNPEVGETKRSP